MSSVGVAQEAVHNGKLSHPMKLVMMIIRFPIAKAGEKQQRTSRTLNSVMIIITE
jgi:hypothetical protein